MNARRFVALAALLLASGSAAAAEVDGAALAAWWGVPFAGMLLSIALMPLLAPKVWHHHYGKIALGWALAFMLPYAVLHGAGAAGSALVHALVAEYIPFIILLVALFTAAGGIYIRGNLHGSPATNTAIMGVGSVLALAGGLAFVINMGLPLLRRAR